MIVVDTSALMAIVLAEPMAEECIARIAVEDRLLISAATVTECLIVAARRGRGADMRRLIDDLGLEVVSLTREAAVGAATAYDRWGKGVHPASLNVGDCFAYELARRNDCALLFVGEDFTKTDLVSVL